MYTDEEISDINIIDFPFRTYNVPYKGNYYRSKNRNNKLNKWLYFFRITSKEKLKILRIS